LGTRPKPPNSSDVDLNPGQPLKQENHIEVDLYQEHPVESKQHQHTDYQKFSS